MGGVLPLLIMVAGAMVPFALMTWLVSRGKTGLALTKATLIGTATIILLYAAARPVIMDPLRALGWFYVLGVPALLGCGAGALLRWMIRRKRERG